MVALGPALTGLAQWARKHVGPRGSGTENPDDKSTHFINREGELVSSKTRILNQLNKKQQPWGLRLGDSSNRCTKCIEVDPPKNITYTFSQPFSHHLKAWYWFWQTAIEGRPWYFSDCNSNVLTLHYCPVWLTHSIILSIRCSGTSFRKQATRSYRHIWKNKVTFGDRNTIYLCLEVVACIKFNYFPVALNQGQLLLNLITFPAVYMAKVSLLLAECFWPKWKLGFDLLHNTNAFS